MYAREQAVSYLASRVIGAPPKPPLHTAKQAGPCVLCGRWIEPTEQTRTWGDNKTFMNWSAMALPVEYRDWDEICIDCASLQNREAMQRYNKHVLCEAGLFPFRSLNERAYWLLHPPEPPFAIALSRTGNQFHIWWRGTLNRSREVFCVQHGERLRWIERARVAQTARDVLQAWRANGQTMPFVTDLNSDNPQAFQVVRKAKGGKDYRWPDASLAQRLMAMRQDDLWAVMTITLSSRYREVGENLEKPEREKR